MITEVAKEGKETEPLIIHRPKILEERATKVRILILIEVTDQTIDREEAAKMQIWTWKTVTEKIEVKKAQEAETKTARTGRETKTQTGWRD